jgi:hypothetical protein
MFCIEPRGRVDLVWKHPDNGQVIVAWEIDGFNVPERHVFGHLAPPPWKRNAVGIIRKLSETRAPIKVHALYSHSPKRGLLPRPDPQRVQNWHNSQEIVSRQDVRVRTDQQLLGGVLMEIIAEAAQAQTPNCA